MTTITKRVSGVITEGTTKRVDYFDAVAGGSDFDYWGGTWGGYLATNTSAWGRSWTTSVGSTPGSPALDITKRVDASALTENTTKRVTI